MSLRRFFIASSLILSPLGFGSAAFAGTTSNIELNATVPVTANITSTPTTEAANLYDSISQSQRGIVKIADFNVTTNTFYVTLTASSTNGGNLRNISGGDIEYKLEITGDGGAAPTNGFSTVTNFSENMNGNRDLYIEIPITNMVNAPAGTYSDTLTLTISTGN
jgi:spore coat protein U-like protein